MTMRTLIIKQLSSYNTLMFYYPLTWVADGWVLGRILSWIFTLLTISWYLRDSTWGLRLDWVMDGFSLGLAGTMREYQAGIILGRL